MAIKRDAPIQTLDAAVEVAAGDDFKERRARAIYQTPGERRKADKDAKRNRKHIDLPEALEKLIDELAEALGTSNSSVMVYLLTVGARQVTMEELYAARRFTRSMRYEYALEPPEIPRKVKE